MENDKFLPTVRIAALIFRIQRSGAQRLDANSKNCPGAGMPFDLEQARITIGERLISAIGFLSLKYEKRIKIVSKDRQFTDELANRLMISLGIRFEAFSLGFLDILADEFYRWNLSRENTGYSSDKQGDLYAEFILPTELPPL